MRLFKRAQRISFSREAWGHPFFLWTVVVSLVLIGGMTALILWKIMPIGLQRGIIPLHYNVYFGVDLLGRWFGVLYLPILGVILLIANMFFARLLWSKERLLSFFFAATALLLEIVLFASVVLITLLNL